jgi:hypothetical protein
MDTIRNQAGIFVNINKSELDLCERIHDKKNHKFLSAILDWENGDCENAGMRNGTGDHKKRWGIRALWI